MYPLFVGSSIIFFAKNYKPPFLFITYRLMWLPLHLELLFRNLAANLLFGSYDLINNDCFSFLWLFSFSLQRFGQLQMPSDRDILVTESLLLQCRL